MSARLIVSLSDVVDEALPECVALAADLDTRDVPLSLLVRARSSAPGAIHHGSPSWHWLCVRSRLRDAVVLHGDDQPGLGRHGEFAALRRHEARLRLIAAVRGLTGLGLASDSFAAPRWAASAGTRAALRELGFRVCVDVAGVHRLGVGEVLRGRVLTLAHSETGQGWWSRAMIGSAERAARRGGLVRIAVRAGDLVRPGQAAAVLEAVDTALRYRAVALTYPELATPRLAAQSKSA